MATRYSSPKKTVDLNGPRRTGSRIRRDPPPPPPRKVTRGELRAKEAKVIVLGIGTLGLVLFILLLQVSRAAGWSPGTYTILLSD